MRIAELIHGLPIELVCGSASMPIGDLVEDSRSATPGCLFAARAGRRIDGRGYIHDAVDRGAVAVLTDRRALGSVPQPVAALVTADVSAVLGRLAERFFGHPARRLRLVGVTGTNGKTTITHLVQHVLCSGGMRCGLIGTVTVDDGARCDAARWTTPPAIEISRLLGCMVSNGCQAAAIEVSSHALDQRRTDGLTFSVGVFSNLTGDHLDYHGTAEAYAAAKARLFEALEPVALAVVNADDPHAPRMLRDCPAASLSCSLRDPRAECLARVARRGLSDVHAHMLGPWGAFDVRLPLIGSHNVLNALQATAACAALGLEGPAIAEALATCSAPPGRLERVPGEAGDPVVLVDYAHSDDALRRALETLRGLLEAAGTGGRLVVVFGCGGDRDRTKRPRMGAVAAAMADRIVITSDNPRSEDPASIIRQVLQGVPPRRRDDTVCVPDRAQAIALAVDESGPGDVVLIAGKGHETEQITGTQRRSFDDRAVAAAALRARRDAARDPVGAVRAASA
jgi:UDP-N-acetylmuramoyl-L-alanyl-D-glutamate--2,6-diaminopimelate ligase